MNDSIMNRDNYSSIDWNSLYDKVLGDVVEPWSPRYQVHLPNVGTLTVRDVFTGGMGVVYIIYITERKRLFALKTFQKKYIWNEAAISLFKEEARTWIAIGKHENIVNALSVELIEGKPHILLEYVEGNDLRTIMKSSSLSLKQSLEIAIQVANGLEYAYNKNKIIHRDIKPENIMLNTNGKAQITDFGLSMVERLVQTTEQLDSGETKPRQNVAGTPPYMAPEQFEMNASVSSQSDIYSFGVLIYELVTSTLPFQANTISAYKDLHQKHNPKEPKKINSKIPDRLNTLILRCIEKKPENRFQSFATLKDELVNIYFDLTQLNFPIKNKEFTPLIGDVLMNCDALINMGYNSEALELVKKLLEQDTENPQINAKEGLILQKLEKYDESINSLKRAVDLVNRSLSSMDNEQLLVEKCEYLLQLIQSQKLEGATSGLVNVETESYITEAIMILDSIINKGCRYYKVYVLKALILRESIHFHQDIEMLLYESIKTNPKDYLAQFHLGNYFYENENYESALRTFNEVLLSNPRFFEALFQIAQVHSKISLPQYAIYYLLQALKINPRHVESQLLLAKLLILIGAKKLALDALFRIVEIEPENNEVLVAIGTIFLLEENYKQASKAFDFAAEITKKQGIGFYGQVLELLDTRNRCQHFLKNGIRCPDKGTNLFSKLDVSAIEYDPFLNSLWIGFGPRLGSYENFGLHCCDLEGNLIFSITTEDGLLQNDITCIKVTKFGIFVGTLGGMTWIDLKNGEIKKFDGRKGLYAGKVNSIDIYENHLWLATYNGVFRFEPTTEEFHHFGIKHGLLSSHVDCCDIAVNRRGDVCVCSRSRYDLHSMKLPIYVLKDNEFHSLSPPNLIEHIREREGDEAAQVFVETISPKIYRRLIYDDYRKIRRKSKKSDFIGSIHVEGGENRTDWEKFKNIKIKDLELAISAYRLACINPEIVIASGDHFIFNFGSKLCTMNPETDYFKLMVIEEYDDSSALIDQSITSISEVELDSLPFTLIGLSDGRVYITSSWTITGLLTMEKRLIRSGDRFDASKEASLKDSTRSNVKVIAIKDRAVYIADRKHGIEKISLQR